MATTFKIVGATELRAKLEKNMDLSAVKTVVKKNGSELHTSMQNHAVFVKGYSTGATRQSIRLTIKDGGNTAEVEPGTLYSPYLEYGTRFMASQPFVGPAFNQQTGKFISDLTKLMK